MRKIFFAVIALFLTVNLSAAEYKTMHLIAPELRNGALAAFTEPQKDIEAMFSQINENMLKAAQNDKIQPDKKIVAPAKGAQSEVAMYVYYPKNRAKPLPAIYFIHGGGYLFGNARQKNAALFELAEDNKAAVISVEYRLATQAPFPADLHDAYHGLAYLFNNAKSLGIDRERIIIMGESAGGGLAARLGLFTRDRGEFKLAGQVLIYPMLDHRTGTDASPYKNPNAGEFICKAEFNRLGWQKLRGGKDIGTEQMPYFSPSLASNLSGLPATFMMVGDLDLFINEDLDYANKLISADVAVELYVVRGAYHAFEIFAPTSPQAMRYEELRNAAIQRMFAK